MKALISTPTIPTTRTTRTTPITTITPASLILTMTMKMKMKMTKKLDQYCYVRAVLQCLMLALCTPHTHFRVLWLQLVFGLTIFMLMFMICMMNLMMIISVLLMMIVAMITIVMITWVMGLLTPPSLLAAAGHSGATPHHTDCCHPQFHLIGSDLI